MPATLDDLLTKIEAQDKTIADQGKQLTNLVESQSQIAKALEKPVYPAGGAPNPTVVAELIDKDAEARWHLKSFGHFLSEVKKSPSRTQPSETLQKAYSWAVEKAIVGANETVGAEGGFLVPPEFSNKVFGRVYKDSALLSRCDNYTVQGNGMTFPRSSETSRANGSRYGGVSSAWVAEGVAGSLSKPGFGTLTLRLHKLISLGGITQELMDDQSVMPQYMTRVFADEINFMISDAIVRGTGAGQPQGLLTTSSRVTVSKEAGQTADTINTQNIVKMWARLWSGARANSIWLYNQDIEPQLFLMTLGIGTAGVVTYMPPGGLSGNQYATLMGRPMFPIEQASTLGDEGDLILVDLSQYVTIGKGGMSQAQSMHFYFDTDQQAFRVTLRMDGQPWWSAALTPYKGTNTQSWCVTLEAR